MRGLSGAECLDLWERGFALHPVDQGVLALSSVLPDTPAESISNWPIGDVNRALVELHCTTFGSQLEAAVRCPECDGQLEFAIDARAFLADEQSTKQSICMHGHSFRLPASVDLAAAASAPDIESAMIRLIESCRLPADSSESSIEELTADELDSIGQQMALADPIAEIRVDLACSACSHQWEETIDIVAFLWAELKSRARRILYDIHTLASAYGWTEGQILALSDRRRQAYMEMVQG